jgi:hypothetical protein
VALILLLIVAGWDRVSVPPALFQAGPPILAALALAAGVWAFGSAEVGGGTKTAWPASSRKPSNVAPWSPRPFRPARAVDDFLGMGGWRQLRGQFLPWAILVFVFQWDWLIPDTAVFPWEARPWHYLLLPFVVGLGIRAIYRIEDQQTAYFFLRGVPFAEILGVRVQREIRLLAVVSGLGAVLLVAVAGPLKGIAWTAWLFLWGFWTLLVARKPHVRAGVLLIVGLAAALPLLAFVGGPMTRVGHGGLAGFAVVTGAWAILDLRRFLKDPKALDAAYRSEPARPRGGGVGLPEDLRPARS